MWVWAVLVETAATWRVRKVLYNGEITAAHKFTSGLHESERKRTTTSKVVHGSKQQQRAERNELRERERDG